MCLITISIRNNLVKLQARVKNSWAQIDVQLKRRYDLVPNLVETVKGYAAHEKETLSAVTQARASVGAAKTSEESIQANKELSGALARLLVVSENYPELKANTNFTSLQNELSDLEKHIAVSRQFYNDTVMKYNEKIKLFPQNIVASIFKFKEEPYFTVDDVVREAPQVKF